MNCTTQSTHPIMMIRIISVIAVNDFAGFEYKI